MNVPIPLQEHFGDTLHMFQSCHSDVLLQRRLSCVTRPVPCFNFRGSVFSTENVEMVWESASYAGFVSLGLTTMLGSFGCGVDIADDSMT